MHRCKKKKETPAAFDRDAPSSFPNKNERITLHAIRILHFRLRELRRRERREKRGRKNTRMRKERERNEKKNEKKKIKREEKKETIAPSCYLRSPHPLPLHLSPLPLRICAHPASSWMEREKEKKRKEYRVGASDKRAVRRRSVIFSRKERICSIGGRITVAALI